MVRILGFAIPGQHVYTTALFYCDRLGINGIPLKFLVDTGNIHTIITEKTAKQLGIDLAALFSKKPDAHLSGIGGSTEGFRLANIRLVFAATDGSPVEEPLQFIIVMKFPKPRNEEERKAMELIPDLIGLDVIRRYSLSFEKNLIYFDK